MEVKAAMQKIKVNFADFYASFKKTDNDFYNILSKHFDVEISEEPDYLFYSCMGFEHLKYDCIKIFYTGECETPDFNLCDYAIGFDYMDFGDRYLRFPLYRLFSYRNELLNIENQNDDTGRTEFCSFVVSNDLGTTRRKEMFELLSTYKRVDSGGRYLNNVGGAVKDKFSFDKKHKFSIVFENCIYPGYTTEKIMQAFVAGTIPIYSGDPMIAREFNTNAFVICC